MMLPLKRIWRLLALTLEFAGVWMIFIGMWGIGMWFVDHPYASLMWSLIGCGVGCLLMALAGRVSRKAQGLQPRAK